LLSRAEPEVLEGLERFGWELGISYQIADDLLDLLTMQDVPDKTGRDLCNGLYTLPVVHALNRSERLRSLLEDRACYDDEFVAEAIAIVRATGGVQCALEEFRSHMESARTAIAGFPSPQGLERILDCAVERCAEAA
jgi:octaprenyl-diphosphate synthase